MALIFMRLRDRDKKKFNGPLRSENFLLIALLLLSTARAEEVKEAVELEPMVVTTHPLGSIEEPIVQPTSVLTKQKLLTKDTRNIGEAVTGELGVSSSDFGPAAGRPIIRGLSGARVRVLEDGIGTMDVSGISPDHAVAIEPLLADQIEIFRGPATLLYGSGISGGVVNVVEHRILSYVPEAIEGDLYGHYNSVANGATGAVRLNAGAGHFAFHVDGLRRDTNDYGIPGFARIDPKLGAKSGVLKNSDTHTENFAGGSSIVGEPGFLGFAVSRFSNNYGVPATGEEEGVRIDQAQTRFDIKGALYEPIPGIKTIKTRWGYSDYSHKELESSGEVGTVLDNKAWEGRVEFLHQPLGPWEGVFGLQFHHRDLSSVGEEAYLPPAQRAAMALFALEKRDWRRWHFEVGGRFEHQEARRIGDTLKVHHNLLNISGGASWAFAKDYSVGVNVSHTQRAPSLEELFSNGPHLATDAFVIGDSALNKEISNNVDLSLRKVEGRWRWKLNLFANFIDNFIFLQELDQNGDGIADRVDREGMLTLAQDTLLLVKETQADARFLGAEFETMWSLFDDARGKLNLRLWTDYVRGQLVNGPNLPRMTPLRFGSDLNYERGPWYAGLNIMRVQRQNEVALLETATQGYMMWNAHVEYRLALGPVQYTFFLQGRNLLDEEARRHTSFLKNQAPLPGRSAMVGMKATF